MDIQIATTDNGFCLENHPFLEGHIPENLRYRRALTEAEYGIYKEGDLINPPPSSLSLNAKPNGWYQITEYPHILLHETQREELLPRMNNLVRSILGKAFLEEFEKVGSSQKLMFQKIKNIEKEVIIFSPLQESDGAELAEERAPLEWMKKSSAKEYLQMWEEIVMGQGPIQIPKDHPQAKEIFQIIRSLCLRPSGALLLRSINAFGQKNVAIVRYKKEVNRVCPGTDYYDVYIDLEAPALETKASLNKTDGRYVKVPKWPEATVAHELIHVFHELCIKFKGEKQIDFEYLWGADPLDKIDPTFYKNYTDYEEQKTILGGPDPSPSAHPSENDIRYECGQPLRIQHVRVDFSTPRFFSLVEVIENNPLNLDSLQLAIYNLDIEFVDAIFDTMHSKKITDSLKFMIGKIVKLHPSRRKSLYAVIDHAIVSMRICSSFVVKNLSSFVHPKIEKEDLRALFLLLRHRATVKSIKNSKQALKALCDLPILEQFPNAKRKLTRLLEI